MSEQNSNPNLAIWEQVKQTDPKYTKSFKRAGGFSGTAIDPMYNIYRATALFGPIGIGWGYDVLEEQVVEGAPITNDGKCVGHEKLHEMKVKVWFKHGDEIGYLISSGATMIVSKNKYGAVTDEEAVKKSLTDAISKALSWLGFSADVHLGMFDDNKYVQGLKSENNQQKPQSAAQQNQTGASQQQAQKPGEQQTSGESGQQQAANLPQDLPKLDGVNYRIYTASNGKFVLAEGNTYQKGEILKSLGFTMHPQQKIWYRKVA